MMRMRMMRMMAAMRVCLVALLGVAGVAAYNNGAPNSLLPPLGWSSTRCLSLSLSRSQSPPVCKPPAAIVVFSSHRLPSSFSSPSASSL
jgi:hypothetical protein